LKEVIDDKLNAGDDFESENGDEKGAGDEGWIEEVKKVAERKDAEEKSSKSNK